MQGSKIRTKHDPRNMRPEPLDEVDDVRIQFGCPTGDVRNFEFGSSHKVHHGSHRLNAHDFLAAGPGAEMTVTAFLITKKADVDLEYLGLIPNELKLPSAQALRKRLNTIRLPFKSLIFLEG